MIFSSPPNAFELLNLLPTNQAIDSTDISMVDAK